MTLEEVGGALTSYIIAGVAMVSDYGVLPAMGVILLCIRLVYEGLRLYRYVTNSDLYN